MSTSEFPVDPLAAREYQLLAQESRESRERARLGGFFYPLAVGLGFVVTTREYVLQAVLLIAYFIALAVFRLAIRAPEAPSIAQIRVHLRRLWTVVLLTNVSWGAFSVFSFVALPEPAPLVAVLFSGAFGMALAHSLCMRRLPCAIGILFVMVPTQILLWRDVAPGVAVMWAVYMGYMLLVLMRSYREYRTRLELEVDLREQRDRFEVQSRIDDLTGIFNRRTFATAMATALEDAIKGAPVSMMIVDIDYFKNINDTHGHLAGDGCLVEMAQRMRKHFDQPGDVIGRLGGEEFGVLVHCAIERAKERAERFRLDLQSTPLVYEGGVAPATVSIGCGSFDAKRHEVSDVFYREVDAALYKAKLSGRNRTECADGLRVVPAGVAPAG